jgi:hypothetical protein
MLKTSTFMAGLSVLAIGVGCGDDPEHGHTRAHETDPNVDATDARANLNTIPDECRGFEVAGLRQSPGGDVLPNTCAPFHGTYNNPYAIRCVDADPDYKTEWRGDEFCILPPPPDKGTQIHVGPDSYDDPDDYEPFLLEPGAEINTFYYAKSDNDEPQHYYRTNWRMRDGSHHMIVRTLAEDRDDGWAAQSENQSEFALGGMGFGGSQRTDSDRPQGTLDVPPENEGLGGEIEAHQQFSFNLHHMNRFDEPILREAWMNVWYMDAKDVKKPMRGVGLIGNPLDVGVPAGDHRFLHYAAEVSGNPRIITLFGHRHANTDRFGVWVERKDGEMVEAYESFDYTDMPVYQYDSISENPEADVENAIDGGYSGLLELSEGDTLHFVCDINNRSGVTLRFVNELMTGEMCIVFGSMTGEGSFGTPTRVIEDEE